MKLAALFFSLAAACTAPLASAATYRIDDSMSLPRESTTAMKWRSIAPGRDMGYMVEGSNIVTVRLNLAPWLNKTGKIYMVLPEQPIGQVMAEWSTQGKLLPGQLVSGNRTLVYSGLIRSSLLEDTIVLKLSADGRRLIAPLSLQFYFEIDVD
ncbi:MAG TPA: hypothetical protein VEG27_09135 [Usitatibacter sp.]|nr:hypothetical protein [Usitatibacter sp.]